MTWRSLYVILADQGVRGDRLGLLAEKLMKSRGIKKKNDYNMSIYTKIITVIIHSNINNSHD